MRSVEGHWKGVYRFDAGQGEQSGREFEMRGKFEPVAEGIGGSFSDKAGSSTVSGKTDGDRIEFEKRYISYDGPKYGRRESEPISYQGTLSSDEMSGTWTMRHNGQIYKGTWHLQRYQPSTAEKFWDGERQIAVGLFVASLIAGYVGAVRPILAAYNHEHYITVHSWMIIAFACGVPFSIAGMIFGQKGSPFLEQNILNRWTPKGIAVLMVIAIPAVALYAGIQYLLGSLGYR